MNAATWDSGQNKFITFGGALYVGGVFTTRNTVWIWSPTTGWTQPPTPATAPPARRNMSIAYNPISQRTVLFSGSTGVYFTDTWEYNSATNVWTDKTPAASPAPRYGQTLFFNPDSGKVDVFGSSSNADNEDLWEWNGTAWNEVTVIGTVPPTYNRMVGYDNVNHSIVAFGGRDVSLLNFNPVNTFVLVKNRPNSSVEACLDAQVDYDNDGKLGCADDECWPVCDPLTSPGTSRPAGATYCGDNACNGPEDCYSCPADCSSTCGAGKCGDFHCDTNETTTCPSDC
jgi:hypothetical protein